MAPAHWLGSAVLQPIGRFIQVL